MVLYLKNNRPNEEQPKIELFLHNPEVIVGPRYDAPNEDWAKYWKTCNKKESDRLEGIFTKRTKEARKRSYDCRIEEIKNKVIVRSL